jgi:hypothetical protein
MSRSTVPLACAAALALASCSAARPPEAAASSSALSNASDPSRSTETPARAATSGNAQIAPDILAAAGIDKSDAFFPFDSSRLENGT